MKVVAMAPVVWYHRDVYIRKTVSRQGTKTYTNYLLVEAITTPKGPRQRVVCSLGNLKPRSGDQWLELVRKVEARLSGQLDLFDQRADPEVDEVVARAERRPPPTDADGQSEDDVISVRADQVEVTDAREAGPVHIGYQMLRRLGMDRILSDLGMSEEARQLTSAMVLNRLVSPASEHAMPGWMSRTALWDVLGSDAGLVSDDRLYRHLDRLHPLREQIEAGLAAREDDLFGLDNTVYLYDLTSTYFEGQMLGNPQALRGHAKDHRPDCKQLVIGLVVNRDGFARAHEVFAGNRQDGTTVDDMLSALGRRVGLRAGATVVVDRGMCSAQCMAAIRKHGLHYLVACRQTDREDWLSEFEADDGWEELRSIQRERDGVVETLRILVRPAARDGESYVLCLSDGRAAKDRAIREKQEERLLKDLDGLKRRVATGKLQDAGKVHQAIGRLKERYSRVARYYQMDYDEQTFTWKEDLSKKALAAKLDGAYILKTDRQDLDAQEIWRTYVLLTRAEAAFRDMKSPLSERPIFHQLRDRAEAHIFLCILAYHLLVSIEHLLREAGDHRSWETIREELRTHQVVTVVLPTTSGDTLHIRRATRPEPSHLDIYRKLAINPEVIKPRRTWITSATV